VRENIKKLSRFENYYSSNYVRLLRDTHFL